MAILGKPTSWQPVNPANIALRCYSFSCIFLKMRNELKDILEDIFYLLDDTKVPHIFFKGDYELMQDLAFRCSEIWQLAV